MPDATKCGQAFTAMSLTTTMTIAHQEGKLCARNASERPLRRNTGVAKGKFDSERASVVLGDAVTIVLGGLISFLYDRMWGPDVARIDELPSGCSSSHDGEATKQWMRKIEMPRYLPGTHVPVNGWFQPCVKCSELTARTTEDDNDSIDNETGGSVRCSSSPQKVTFMCGRCAHPNGKRPFRKSLSSASDVSASSDDSNWVIVTTPPCASPQAIKTTAPLCSDTISRKPNFGSTSSRVEATDSTGKLEGCGVSDDRKDTELMDVITSNDESIGVNSMDSAEDANHHVDDIGSEDSASSMFSASTTIESPEPRSKIPSSPQEHVADAFPIEVVPSVIESVLADFLSDKAPFSWTYWPCAFGQNSSESDRQTGSQHELTSSNRTVCLNNNLVL